MTPSNILSEAEVSIHGIAINSPDVMRLKENLWAFMSGTEYQGNFVLSISPYDPEILWIMPKAQIPEETLAERGGTITKAGWTPRRPGRDLVIPEGTVTDPLPEIDLD